MIHQLNAEISSTTHLSAYDIVFGHTILNEFPLLPSTPGSDTSETFQLLTRWDEIDENRNRVAELQPVITNRMDKSYSRHVTLTNVPKLQIGQKYFISILKLNVKNQRSSDDFIDLQS